MACMKLGSKTDAFQRKGQAWFCTTGLPSDIIVEVGEMTFHLHKFPLLSRSGVMEKRIAEASEGEDGCVIELNDIPGGAKTFELVAKFCYGVKLELTAGNAVYLRCAAEHLDMTEEYGEGNLISQTEIFLNQVVLRSWKDSLKALQTCDDVLPYAEELRITKRCIDSLAVKACTDPNLFGWPVMEHVGPLQSPGGSILWNGISTGARPKHSSSDWWYEDASTLSLPLYKRLIFAMESQGVKQDIVAGSLSYYAKKYLPGLNRRQTSSESTNRLAPVGLGSSLSEEDQKLLLEEVDNLLPMQKGLVPTKFLFGLLKTALILRASPSCISNLEKRIGMQLDQATLEDLLMPNFSSSLPANEEEDEVLMLYGSESGWVEAKSHCDHLASLSSDLTHIPTPDTPCNRCQHPAENWLCLCCKEVLCSRFVNKHMLEHHKLTDHSLALSFSDLSVWCFSCNAYLDAQVIMPLQSVHFTAYVLKFNEPPPLRAVECVHITDNKADGSSTSGN